MARNLGAAGHDGTIWTRNPKTLAQFCRNTPAVAAFSPADLAHKTEVVVTISADNDALHTVYLGENSIFSALSGAQIFLEMRTTSPFHLARLQTQAGRRLLLDAHLRRQAIR